MKDKITALQCPNCSCLYFSEKPNEISKCGCDNPGLPDYRYTLGILGDQTKLNKVFSNIKSLIASGVVDIIKEGPIDREGKKKGSEEDRHIAHLYAAGLVNEGGEGRARELVQEFSKKNPVSMALFELSEELWNNGIDMTDQKERKLRERINVFQTFKVPTEEAKIAAEMMRLVMTGYDWELKLAQERTHYGKLRYTLAHSFAENYFYMKEEPHKTRRIVTTSSDCITGIVIQIRPPHLHMSVLFRSSHLAYLLPADLYFLTNLAVDFLNEIETTRKTFGGKWNLDVTDIEIAMLFSSLHTNTEAE